jgi:hypothetical protein
MIMDLQKAVAALSKASEFIEAAKAEINTRSGVAPTVTAQPNLEARFADGEDAKIIRDMIWHEDVVLNSRLTWCGTIEALLMAGLAFGWDKAPSAIVYIVAVAGAVVGISTFYATRTAVETMRELTMWWTNNHIDTYRGPDVIGHRVDRWRWKILRPSLALPSVFVCLWVAVLIARVLTDLRFR